MTEPGYVIVTSVPIALTAAPTRALAETSSALVVAILQGNSAGGVLPPAKRSMLAEAIVSRAQTAA